MNVIAMFILAFSVLGAIDYAVGNKIGMGKEFERAFALFSPMALTMLGMIVIAPAIGAWLTPFFEWFYKMFHIDPSILPASLFANDMGGTQLAQAVCKAEDVGNYNAFVISSMMGCAISFTIPFSLGIVKKNQHKELFFGLLCGIVVIPVGSFVAGLILGLKPLVLFANLLPLIILAVVVGLALVLVPKLCIKCFAVFGTFMKILAIGGLMCSVFTFLTKIKISPYFDTFENAAFICANACVTLSGALPFMFLVSKIFNKPLNRLGSKIGIDGASTLALLGSLVTNASTFGVMEKMNKKGVVLNSAFAVTGAFAFGSHLAFTMAFDNHYVLPMIAGKLIAGVCAIVLALLLYKGNENETYETADT